MTAFVDLPESGITGIRWVGSCLMDAEQFAAEGWHLDRGEWRADLAGLRSYSQVRQQRRQERKSAWQARVDRDEEYSESITELIEKGTPNG